VARPVNFGRILHRQHDRDVVQAAVGGLEVAVQDVVRLDGVVRKETIGALEHGIIATGFRQSGSGRLGQDVRELYEARGASDITAFGLGKFGDGPGRVIGEGAHAQLLGQWVALGAGVGS
jgi:hypothetical protein